MLERTETRHLPPAFDPTPIEQGIGVAIRPRGAAPGSVRSFGTVPPPAFRRPVQGRKLPGAPVGSINRQAAPMRRPARAASTSRKRKFQAGHWDGNALPETFIPRSGNHANEVGAAPGAHRRIQLAL